MIDCGKIGLDFDLVSVGDYFDVKTVVEATMVFCVTFVGFVAVAENGTKRNCFGSEILHQMLLARV